MEIISRLRERLRERWDLVVGVTDVPPTLVRRATARHASPTRRAAVLSRPLGAARTSQ